MGSQEVRVDLELMKDMMVVRCCFGTDEWKYAVRVCAPYISMILSNRARHQSFRTAYIACAGELLRLRQLACSIAVRRRGASAADLSLAKDRLWCAALTFVRQDICRRRGDSTDCFHLRRCDTFHLKHCGQYATRTCRLGEEAGQVALGFL